jgi:hypothetical protein
MNPAGRIGRDEALGPDLVATKLRPIAGIAAPLRTRELGRVFRNTSSSYKYFWFLAIVDLLPELDKPIEMRRVIQYMMMRAWAASALFRLSLGKVDRLQACVRAAQVQLGLPARSSRQRLDKALSGWPSLDDWVEDLSRFVPGRFLSVWFPDVARLAPYDRRNGSRALAAAAENAWGGQSSGPYRLCETEHGAFVELAPSWRDWLSDNRVIILGYAEMHLARYLQARNPNVPAIVQKLDIPRRRSTRQARDTWNWVRSQNSDLVRDIFADTQLGAEFEIDHFLPWTFVAHDEFWNLCPVTSAVNRDKSDKVPALDTYLPRLAALHASIIVRADLPRALAAAYSEFMGVPVRALAAVDANAIADRYEAIVRPLAQIAVNNGFPADWSFCGQKVHPTFRMRAGDRRRELVESCGAQGVNGDQDGG